MRILVVGGGGREHALCWKLRQSSRVTDLYCAPGNAGITQVAECVPIAANDVQGLAGFARRKSIDLTVVGPEEPLTRGLTDVMEAGGLRVFGPSAAAAALEGSKVLAKDIMLKYGIPTADYATFEDSGEAVRYISKIGAPCVIKADGLAAGKGVVVASTEEEAVLAVKEIMEDRIYGEAGKKVIVEEMLVGEEVSLLAFTDGRTVMPMLPAQDHKPVYDGDRGPNTGGMGAYAPAPVCTPGIYRFITDRVLEPMVRAMIAEGREYKGVLYAGMMITAKGPMVLEFNVRFGDPEAQPLMALLKTDLLDIMEAVVDRRLEKSLIEWHNGAAVCVVMASGGYPGPYEKAKVINGLENVPGGVVVFHAGTALAEGRTVTSGGRVLGITATGPDIAGAIGQAYRGVEEITFEGVQYRRDIGQKALRL